MKGTIVIVFLSFLLSLQSCSDGGTLGIGGVGRLPALSLTGRVISCTVDSDCAIVELGCCDHCNGGWTASVNRDYEKQVRERNHDKCSGDNFCTDIGCPMLFPQCINGTCTSRIEDWQTCEIDDDCVVVELGCCDHCNGGRTVASHKDFANDIKYMMGDECEEDYACTLMACAPVLARCTDNMCETYEDESWGPDTK